MKKWDKENLKQRSNSYISQIKRNHPELAIINYEPYQKDDKKYLEVTLLNDSATVNREKLAQHDEIIDDINLIWRYSPNAGSSNADMQKLQSQIATLQQQITELKKVQAK